MCFYGQVRQLHQPILKLRPLGRRLEFAPSFRAEVPAFEKCVLTSFITNLDGQKPKSFEGISTHLIDGPDAIPSKFNDFTSVDEKDAQNTLL